MIPTAGMSCRMERRRILVSTAHSWWPRCRSTLHYVRTIPEDTVRVAYATIPKGNVYMRMRDTLGPIYTGEAFASLFPPRGQPAESRAQPNGGCL